MFPMEFAQFESSWLVIMFLFVFVVVSGDGKFIRLDSSINFMLDHRCTESPLHSLYHHVWFHSHWKISNNSFHSAWKIQYSMSNMTVSMTDNTQEKKTISNANLYEICWCCCHIRQMSMFLLLILLHIEQFKAKSC